MQNDITRCVHASGHQCILQLSSVGDHSCRLRVGLVEWQLNMSTMTAGIHRQNCGKYLDRSTQRFGIGWENGRVHKHKHVPHHSNLASCWTRIAPIDGPTGSPQKDPKQSKRNQLLNERHITTTFTLTAGKLCEVSDCSRHAVIYNNEPGVCLHPLPGIGLPLPEAVANQKTTRL